jgi:hypothetical protein
MRTLLIFITFLISTVCFAQKTFLIDTSFLDTIEFKRYRVFIASKDLDINFIGKKISSNDRFTPEKLEALAADHAIQTQYANAALQQLDKQYNNFPSYTESPELKRAYQDRRPKIIHRQQKDQKHKIQSFDRYFFGYRNADNEKLILIRFDPHKIRHYTISGERFVDVLSIMVYNVNQNILSYAGWSNYKE